MPSSIASDFASGEAISLPPVAGAAAGFASAFGASLGSAGFGFGFGSAFGSAFGAGSASAGGASSVVEGFAAGCAAAIAAGLAAPPDACATSALISSPALPMIATGAPSLTVSPSLTRNFKRTPSSSTLKSMFALSVSTSAIRSPGDTLSPSFFVQRTSTPSSIVGESFGSPRICAMVFSPNRERGERRPRRPSPAVALHLRDSSRMASERLRW